MMETIVAIAGAVLLLCMACIVIKAFCQTKIGIAIICLAGTCIAAVTHVFGGVIGFYTAVAILFTIIICCVTLFIVEECSNA